MRTPQKPILTNRISSVGCDLKSVDIEMVVDNVESRSVKEAGPSRGTVSEAKVEHIALDDEW